MRFGVRSGLWSLGLVFGLWSLVLGFWFDSSRLSLGATLAHTATWMEDLDEVRSSYGQLVGSIDSGLAGEGTDDAAGSCSDKVGTANSILYVAFKSFLFPVWCWFQAFLS